MDGIPVGGLQPHGDHQIVVERNDFHQGGAGRDHPAKGREVEIEHGAALRRPNDRTGQLVVESQQAFTGGEGAALSVDQFLADTFLEAGLGFGDLADHFFAILERLVLLALEAGEIGFEAGDFPFEAAHIADGLEFFVHQLTAKGEVFPRGLEGALGGLDLRSEVGPAGPQAVTALDQYVEFGGAGGPLLVEQGRLAVDDLLEGRGVDVDVIAQRVEVHFVLLGPQSGQADGAGGLDDIFLSVFVTGTFRLERLEFDEDVAFLDDLTFTDMKGADDAAFEVLHLLAVVADDDLSGGGHPLVELHEAAPDQEAAEAQQADDEGPADRAVGKRGGLIHFNCPPSRHGRWSAARSRRRPEPPCRARRAVWALRPAAAGRAAGRRPCACNPRAGIRRSCGP